jgi:TRAP-type uncharacterized transport system fused permease subunit
VPTILYYLSILLMIQREPAGSPRSSDRGAEDPRLHYVTEDPRFPGQASLEHFAMPQPPAAVRTAHDADWDAAPDPDVINRPDAERPAWRSYYHFTSLVLVAVLMVAGFTAFRAVFWASVAAIVLSFLGRGHEWLGPRRIVQSMVAGAEDVLPVLATTAVAGIIVGVVTLTGLGLKAAGLIVGLAEGSVALTVVFAAIAVWILGLAVPVTASYIISAVMVVPALTTVGVPPVAAHMFIFYYAVLSEVSPPTALAPFAAAAITGGRPFRTMTLTWKYTLPAFVVPFAFTLDRRGMGLLLQADWLTTAVVALTAAAGVAGLALAFGRVPARSRMLAQALLACGSALLVHPSPLLDVAGAVVAGTALLWRPNPRVRPSR